MRDLAEKSVNQARQAFGNFLNVARRTASGIQDSTELTRTTTRDLSARSFDAAEQNVGAAFELAQKLVHASSVQEAMQLQAEFVRSQFAAIQAQAREFGTMAQGAMRQGAEQTRSSMQEAIDQTRRTMEQSAEHSRVATPDTRNPAGGAAS